MHMLLPKSPLPCKRHLDEFNKMVCLRMPSVSYLRTCNKISSSSDCYLFELGLIHSYDSAPQCALWFLSAWLLHLLSTPKKLPPEI